MSAGDTAISRMRRNEANNGHPAKTPIMPALSTRFRNTKSPVTPKLAGSAQPSPSLSPHREVRPNIASIAPADTPPLSGNVTPRSGTRRSRIGTDSPATPGGIASTGMNRARATSITSTREDPRQGRERATKGTGLCISSPGAKLYTAARPQHAVATSASSPTLVRRVSVARSGLEGEDAGAISPFFHADDAKSTTSSHGVPERPKLGSKAGAFFYVGGTVSEGHSGSDSPKAVAGVSPKLDSAKFFHAYDLPTSSPSQTQARPPLNKKKSTTSIGSPRLQPSELQRKSKSPTRPASPLKEASYRSPPAICSPPRATGPITSTDTRLDTARRQSVGSYVSSPKQSLHKKTSSVNIASSISYRAPTSPAPAQQAHPDLPISSNSPPTQYLSRTLVGMSSPESLSPRSTSLTSTNTIPTSSATRSEPSEPSSIIPTSFKPPDIPQPSTQQAQPPQLSDASNARRERKVLDLEISNSSLLAINRTLEREMRKQNAELRRFRRLSRSGRLSVRTISGQSKSSLGTLAELDDAEEGEVDDSEIGSEDDSDEEESSDAGSASVSSGHAIRQRARDEKRLMLDLSKHRQLLIDSEKMSASIRRCLGWTEELIKDGTKALDYKVSVGDVKLGGRVLINEDEGEENRGLSLVSPVREVQERDIWDDAPQMLDA